MRDTTVVIPCFNEAKRLDLAQFQAYAGSKPWIGFLFVDDGSTDDTLDVLRKLEYAVPSAVRVCSHERNAGKAAACRTGMLAALQDGAKYVGFWDADLSTRLEEIEPFRAIMEERADIAMVFGARVNLLGRSVKRNLARHYVGRVFATLTALALHLPIYDSQCGAKLFRATDELAAVLDRPFISRWIFDVEIIARFLQRRRGSGLIPVRDIIYESPLMRWNDVAGSKLHLRDFGIVAADFVRIYGRYLRRR